MGHDPTVFPGVMDDVIKEIPEDQVERMTEAEKLWLDTHLQSIKKG